jgi:hypothetical protein
MSSSEEDLDLSSEDSSSAAGSDDSDVDDSSDDEPEVKVAAGTKRKTGAEVQPAKRKAWSGVNLAAMPLNAPFCPCGS